MKRLFAMAAVTAAVTIVGTAHALAATGDVTGNIYTTDIKAVINGVEVESYALDGKTAVIIEDVTSSYSYQDSLRTLIVYGFAPSSLKESQSVKSGTVGKVVGHTYETDIVTYLYNEKLPTFALNGKMAVAIEDLGADQEFSDIGGKYVWDPEARTISLEFMYDNLSEVSTLLSEKQVDLTVVDNKASFKENKFNAGAYGETYENVKTQKGVNLITMDINGNEECIIRKLWQTRITFLQISDTEMTLSEDDAIIIYCDIDKLKEALEDVTVDPPTIDEIVQGYIDNNMATILIRYDGDGYTFVYMRTPNTHGSSEHLRRITSDGEVVSYGKSLPQVSANGNQAFENVTLDEENEKVYFHYDYDYVIDLKTGEMTKAE